MTDSPFRSASDDDPAVKAADERLARRGGWWARWRSGVAVSLVVNDNGLEIAQRRRWWSRDRTDSTADRMHVAWVQMEKEVVTLAALDSDTPYVVSTTYANTTPPKKGVFVLPAAHVPRLLRVMQRLHRGWVARNATPGAKT